jgi:hypothetical protein
MKKVRGIEEEVVVNYFNVITPSYIPGKGEKDENTVKISGSPCQDTN